MVNKLNKGEWAEFYAFLEILALGKLYAADEEGIKNPIKFYYILSALKKDIEYMRNEETRSITFESHNENVTIPIEKIDALLNPFFQKIKNSKKTFEIPILEPLINTMHIDSVKEGSQNKGDLRLRIHDSLSGHTPIHSFSVKSYLGGAPTLLNASKGTIFTYEITHYLDQSIIDELNDLHGKKGWLGSIIQGIYEHGAQCKYHSLSDETFITNLEMIDFRLPEILGEIFAHGYLVNNKKIDLAIDSYLEYNVKEKNELIKYKMTELLVASALGMVPKSPWSGLEEANGGYIIVKDTSEVLCYHLYERNELKEYLYNNTRFETASTSRYNIGKIYSVNDKQFIDLALQIRFL